MIDKVNIDLIPETLLDKDGYPTKEWLKFLRTYEPNEELPLLPFIRDILPIGWWMADWGYKLHNAYCRERKLELHTGGWSGNEEVIREILNNIYFTHFKMRYVKWETGGHYYFTIKVN